MLGNGHAGFGRRSGETHQQQCWQGAPGRPHRAEGKNHKQAVLSLARRRANVLWAMIRDGSLYQPSQPVRASA